MNYFCHYPLTKVLFVSIFVYVIERMTLNEKQQPLTRGTTMANITIKNIHTAAASHTYNMEVKKIRNMAIKIANSGKRISFHGLDNFYHINVNNNICRRVNLKNSEFKEYVNKLDSYTK